MATFNSAQTQKSVTGFAFLIRRKASYRKPGLFGTNSRAVLRSASGATQKIKRQNLPAPVTAKEKVKEAALH